MLQTNESKLPQPQNILLNLLTITFHLSLFAKTAPLLLLSLFFFLKRPLIDRCQIVTDTCQTNVSKFVSRSLLNHFFQYTNKNISVKPLFNLHYLSLFQLYSLKICSVHGGSCRNYSTNSLGFFWKTFR